LVDAALSRIRVMIVDDNHHMVSLVKTILHGLGIREVLEAHDAAEAFEIMRSARLDILIVDFAMEPLNGIEFVKLVRTADDSTAKMIPIIMLTAYSERSKVEAARDVGVTEFCAKPVTATEIYRKVAAVVNRSRTFVRTKQFFGPDRRRHAQTEFDGDDRRLSADHAEAMDLAGAAARKSDKA
jgi:two-component system chemotaxis response regulator CheY